MLGTILIILLVLMLFGSLPLYPYSTQWGPGPASGIGLLLAILIILLLLGKI